MTNKPCKATDRHRKTHDLPAKAFVSPIDPKFVASEILELFPGLDFAKKEVFLVYCAYGLCIVSREDVEKLE